VRRHIALAALAALALGSRSHAEEDAVWRSAGAVDVHAHIGTFEGYDLSLETLLDNMTRHGIRLALISNIDGAAVPGMTKDLGEVAANQATREAVASHPNLRGLAWARPGDAGSSPDNLRPFLEKDHFVGVKLHPEMNHFAADAKAVDGYLALCEEFHVPAVFHCLAAEPIARAARRHPKVPVVLYHSGFFSDHEEAIRTVEASQKAHDADLYLETAQVEADKALEMVKRVGPERVLFGTDATYYGREHYRHYTELVKLLSAKLSAADFRLVMSGNAERLFRLERR
jgi:predicted TIM-barrel fold metal-dependent hydrolase